MADYTFVVLLVALLFSMLLVLRPVRPRLVGLVVGLFTLAFAGFALADSSVVPLFPFFNAFVGVVGVLCMLRAGGGV